MGESRQELLAWLNNLLQLNLTKVEQCGTGAAYCQIFDSIFLDVPMSKVKFNVNTEYAYIQNFKVLQNSFLRHGIDRPVPVEQLVKCRMQDNLEFLQWAKRYWDQHYGGGEYDAYARRRASGAPPAGGGGGGGGGTGAITPAGRTSTGGGATSAARRGTTPTAAGGPGARMKYGGSGVGGAGSTVATLQQEIATLKESVVGFERERDFYFSKLRDIELLVQRAQESETEMDKEGQALVKDILAILYSTEDGFEIPAEGAPQDDLETF